MTLTHEPTGHVRAVIDTGDGVLVAWCASEQEAREMARAVEQERGRDGAFRIRERGAVPSSGRLI